ncbi:MAG: hypothetical protein PUF83_00330, partial [Intestinibaculum porci]|nr:hypothetical protein [Intestinibaculum porci]
KQIEHLKSKGITFDLVSEKDAFSYLQNESHFFKLIAYRKNYQKYEYGDHAGQYIHLEFLYLKTSVVCITIILSCWTDDEKLFHGVNSSSFLSLPPNRI